MTSRFWWQQQTLCCLHCLLAENHSFQSQVVAEVGFLVAASTRQESPYLGTLTAVNSTGSNFHHKPVQLRSHKSNAAQFDRSVEERKEQESTVRGGSTRPVARTLSPYIFLSFVELYPLVILIFVSVIILLSCFRITANSVGRTQPLYAGIG